MYIRDIYRLGEWDGDAKIKLRNYFKMRCTWRDVCINNNNNNSRHRRCRCWETAKIRNQKKKKNVNSK